MAHRDFVVPERQPGDEITFGVNGRKFKALPTPPIDVVLRMGRPNSVLAELVEGMLVTEDEAAWRDLLRDKSLEVRGPDGFGKVVEDLFWWLVDEQAAVTGEPIVVRPPQPAQEAASPNDFEVFKHAGTAGRRGRAAGRRRGARRARGDGTGEPGGVAGPWHWAPSSARAS
jgi:hypothetical protein